METAARNAAPPRTSGTRRASGQYSRASRSGSGGAGTTPVRNEAMGDGRENSGDGTTSWEILSQPRSVPCVRSMNSHATLRPGSSRTARSGTRASTAYELSVPA